MSLSSVSGAGAKVHPWVGVELRIAGATRGGQHQESKSGVGAQSWSAAEVDVSSLGWGSQGRIGPIVELYWGHLARTRLLGLPEHFGVARLLEDVVEQVYMGYPVSVVRGLVRSLPCSRVAQIRRKIVR